jgi:hypothetical protein
MPRTMPPLAAQFTRRVFEGFALAEAGDLAGSGLVDAQLRKEWHVARVEFLYELSFLRIFIEWEAFLEQTFIRYLCGYAHPRGEPYVPVGGRLCAILQDAEVTMLGRKFLRDVAQSCASDRPSQAAS